MKPRLLSALSFLLGLLLPGALGCDTYETPKFNHDSGLYGERALIVPFAHPKAFRGYGESPKGDVLARVLKNWAIDQHGAEFADGPEATAVISQVGEWDWEERGKSARAWAKIASGLGVRFVVVGEILEIRQTPLTIGYADYQAKASFRVIDVESGRKVYSREEGKVVRIGDPEDREVPVVDLGNPSQEEIERLLLGKLGIEIGKDLYGYMKS